VVDLMEAYAVPTGAGEVRPFVRCNMITSLDGAISLNGRSGMLGGPADTRVFQTLRALADVILVGAGTMRTEGYGPARLDDDVRKQRLERGQRPVPAIAVVTRSGNLDWSSPFFTDAEERPIIFTTGDSDERARVRAQKVAEVVITGDARADARAILEHLQERSHRSVLLEGGPALNAEVVDAGLLDELCLTLSPRLVAGDGPRVLAGPELAEPLDLEVIHLLEEDGFLFYRLGVREGQTR
ncbi:MAG TPA: pyrimidine reductase family protein, partial [Acidimicrobiales bacterium]|nr:pyrimidine reductase family protein [Acidimicrobiales bacterium]